MQWCWLLANTAQQTVHHSISCSWTGPLGDGSDSFTQDTAGDASELVVSLATLPSGGYTVTIHSYVDGHDANDPAYSASYSYQFTAPPGLRISGLQSGATTPASQTILWTLENTTGEPATNIVRYWLHGSGDIFSAAAGSGASLSNTVTVALTGLQDDSLYDYWVQSSNTLANVSAPADSPGCNQFTTPPLPLRFTSDVIRGAYVGNNTALIWTFANDTGQAVHHLITYRWDTDTDFGLGQTTGYSSAGTTYATATLANLQPGATYAYTIQSFVEGHEGDPVYTATISGTFATADMPPPIITINNVTTAVATDTAALIAWNVAQTNPDDWAYHYVVYGTNSVLTADNALITEGFRFDDQQNQVMAILEGLAPATTNYYFVQSVIDGATGHYATADSNGTNYTFITETPLEAAGTSGEIAPVIAITNAPTSFVTDTMALITWGVSNAIPIPGTHFVIWNNGALPTPAESVISSGLDDSAGTAAVLLTGLTPGSTNYYFIQSAQDLGGNHFYATDNNMGIFYTFTNEVSSTSGSGTSSGGGGDGGSGSGSGTGSGDGSESGSGSAGTTGDGSGSTGSDGSGQSNSSGGGQTSGNATTDQPVKITVWFYLDGPDYASATITCNGSGVNNDSRQLTFDPDDDPIQRSLTWDIMVIPGEKYTFTFSWNGHGSFDPEETGYPDRFLAMLQTDSDYCLWRPSDLSRGWILWPEGPGAGDSASTWTLCVPKVEIAVDANRDGTIQFGEADNNPDKTSASEPYRFWLNDDYDVFDYVRDWPYLDWSRHREDTSDGDFVDEADNKAKAPLAPSGGKRDDSWTYAIGSRRDLEDWTKIAVSVKGIEEPVTSVDSLVFSFLWDNGIRAPTSWSALYICPSCEAKDGYGYLENDQTAKRQVEEANQWGAAADQKTPYYVWDDDWSLRQLPRKTEPGNVLKFYFLVAGGWEEKGQLSVSLSPFYDPYYKACQSAPAFFDIKNIKKMYQRKGITDTDSSIGHRADNPSAGVNVGTWQPDSIAFDPPPGGTETDECIIYVHGWRNSNDDVCSYAETLYKRLWWQGYRGRFVVFRWPCLMDFDSFNSSELHAWRSAQYLKSLVAGLKGEFSQVSIIAHSQGNVVVGEALKQGMEIDNYVALEAALPAGCYDDSTQINSYSVLMAAETTWPGPTPERHGKGYVGYLNSALENVRGNKARFFNTQDFATSIMWVANQFRWKPDGNQSWWYKFKPTSASFMGYFQNVGIEYHVRHWWEFWDNLISTHRVYPVTDDNESRAFVARSRSMALGATGAAVAGFESIPLESSVDDFTAWPSDHSGQFTRRIQQVWDLYYEILTKLTY
jgi:hypothetical protein